MDSILNKVVTTIREKVNQLKDINAIKRQDRLRKKPVMNEEDKIRKLYEHSCEELFKIKLFPKKGRNLNQAESADTATAPSMLKTLIQNIESIWKVWADRSASSGDIQWPLWARSAAFLDLLILPRY